jgi:predicted nucleic-acid-binding Zn-ribbon protein
VSVKILIDCPSCDRTNAVDMEKVGLTVTTHNMQEVLAIIDDESFQFKCSECKATVSVGVSVEAEDMHELEEDGDDD